MDYEDRIAEAKTVLRASGYAEPVKEDPNILRAVPRIPYTPGERQAKAEIPTPLKSLIENKTYPVDNSDIDIAEQVGFSLAVRAIYIQAGKHLGPTHPVMQLLRNMR